jgi:hypothetical protein
MIRAAAPVLLLLSTACLVPGRHGRPVLVAPVPVPVVSIRYVDREPPPVRYERAPPLPSPDHIWISGYWSWDGRAHIWIPGRYELRPHPRAAWVDGHWARHERGWHWVEGHWR